MSRQRLPGLLEKTATPSLPQPGRAELGRPCGRADGLESIDLREPFRGDDSWAAWRGGDSWAARRGGSRRGARNQIPAKGFTPWQSYPVENSTDAGDTVLTLPAQVRAAFCCLPRLDQSLWPDDAAAPPNWLDC